MILGPHGLQLLSAEMAGSLKTAGELGLLLMVMDGGLAMELPVLRKQGGRATVLALTGTALPVLLGWATMVALGTGGLAAVAAGTALSSTAIGFTLRMMSDLHLLETSQGQLITAAAMLDDVFSLVLLAMLRALQPAEDGQLRLEAWPLVRPLIASFGVLVAAVACAALTRRIDEMLRSPPQRSPPPPAPSDTPPSDTPPSDGPPHASPPDAHALPAGRWRLRQALLAPSATVAAMVALGVLLAWAAEAVGSSALLGAFVAGTSFCSLPRARVAWAGATAAPQAWLSRPNPNPNPNPDPDPDPNPNPNPHPHPHPHPNPNPNPHSNPSLTLTLANAGLALTPLLRSDRGLRGAAGVARRRQRRGRRAGDDGSCHTRQP